MSNYKLKLRLRAAQAEVNVLTQQYPELRMHLQDLCEQIKLHPGATRDDHLERRSKLVEDYILFAKDIIERHRLVRSWDESIKESLRQFSNDVVSRQQSSAGSRCTSHDGPTPVQAACSA